MDDEQTFGIEESLIAHDNRMIVFIAVTIICCNELSTVASVVHLDSNSSNGGDVIFIESSKRMMTSFSSYVESRDDLQRQRRSAIDDALRIWPKAQIPFVFSDNVDSKSRANILKSMEHYHNSTCIKFIQMKREPIEKSVNHVLFIKHSNSCDSHVGMRGGQQKVNISDRCPGLDSLIHELGHVVGLWHEQSRVDRDAHILIKWNHMNPDFMANFQKPGQMQWLGPYDFSSIMHYDKKMFSDFRGLDVFEPIQNLGIEIGRKAELSFYDKLKLNKLYKCAEHCDATKLKCENGGYLNSLCQCVCPKSLSGSRCQLSENREVCGGVIELKNQKITIASPNFPSNYPPNIDCTWLVKAPQGNQILLTIEEYDIACNDTLEIRNHYIGNKQMLRTCLSLTKFDNRSFTSTSNLLVLNFHSDSIGEGIGFEAAVKSFPSPNCDSSPCKNNGTCYSSHPEIETYFCKCEVGWAGKNCDIPIRDGQWTSWSSWGGCFALCGREERRRVCEEPLNSGLDCPEGLVNESRRCGENLLQCQRLFHCDFDSSRDCGILQNILKDDFDWTRRHFTGNTRDPVGHTTGSGTDYYFAMEGNDGDPWETAVFSIPTASADIGRYCLQFFYHMSSIYAGMLRVIRQTRRTSRVIWQSSGRHPIGWNRVHINIILYHGVKIHFEGTRGDGGDSDIAVDDISLSPLGCYINHHGNKILRPHPKTYKRIHGCVKGNRRFRIATPVNYDEECTRHHCYCNLDGRLDCMVKHLDRCNHRTKS